MTIVYFTKEDDYIGFTPFIQDISNLEAFERELDEQYEFWSYDFDDCVSYLNERKIGELIADRIYDEDMTSLGYDNIDDLFFDNADIWVEIGRGLHNEELDNELRMEELGRIY